MTSTPIAIVGAKRTPIGAFQGALAAATAMDLSAAATRSALAQPGMRGEEVDEVLLGCVLPAGLGQAPARQAALAGGISQGAPCTTVNKMCGSGMKTVMLGCGLIRSGSAKTVLVGGMESMTRAPYLLPDARNGMRMGHRETLDHMFYDGLQSPFDGQMMGHFAEQTAKKYGFSREEQDAFAIASAERAKDAAANGRFDAELAPVTITTRKGDVEVTADETPNKVNVERIPTLRPAFAKDGTVTAASSSSIADGAASLIVMDPEVAAAGGYETLATIIDYSSFAQEPEWFTTSPVFAVQSLLKKLTLSASDIDLFEINEAFACVTMAAMRDVGIEHEKVNVNGGACALGHPIGASGGRILVTLINALRMRGGGRGIASLCIGGGEAVAVAIDVPAG
ncbi:MAG: thiolase family protein [Pseudomonadota bacterium]